MKPFARLSAVIVSALLLVACGGGGGGGGGDSEPPTLSTIQISPSSSSIPKYTTQQFTAVGTYSDGSTLDITNQVTWGSSNTATVSFTNNLATAASEGTITVSATLAAISASTQFSVAPPELTSLAVTAPSTSIALGEGVQVSAIGTYLGGVDLDVTSSVAWSSSNSAFATVSPSGAVSSLAAGSVTINAELSGVTDNIGLTVLPASLVSISITPDVATVEDGKSIQLTATGIYSDTTTQDLTTLVTWASNTNSIATVSNDQDAQGLVIGVNPGNTLITAGLGSVTAQVSLDVLANPNGADHISMVATPNVILNNGSDTSVLSITVIPNDTTSGAIPDGTIVDYLVTGQANLSSTSETTISGSSSISVSATTIQNAIVTASVRDTIAAGDVSIKIVENFSDAFSVIGNSSAVIINGYYQAGSKFTIEITNTSNRVFNLSRFRFTNGGAIIAETTDPSLLSNNSVSENETVGITVTLNSNQFDNGLVGTYYLDDPVTGQDFSVTYGDTSYLTSIEIIDAEQSKRPCDTYQLSAIGHYDDGTTQDITALVNWSSMDATIVSTGGGGILTALRPGSTNISATYGGVSAASSIIVGDTLTSITIAPENRSIALGMNKQFIATAAYQDGGTSEVTSLVSWSSSDTGIATIDNTGLAISKGEGVTNITGACGDMSSSTQLSVTPVELVSLSINQQDRVTIRDGETTQLVAIGTFSDGTTADLTNSVIWTAFYFGLDVATVTGTGLVISVGPGDTAIEAEMNGIYDSIFITVQ